jgi:hypothetical protein
MEKKIFGLAHDTHRPGAETFEDPVMRDGLTFVHVLPCVAFL